MGQILTLIDQLLSSNIIRDITIYDILSNIFKYIFVVIIYRFIFNIVRMIYLDIENISKKDVIHGAFLRLINRKETLGFKIQDIYPIDSNVNIGRHRSNEIVLRDDYISKHHARIIREKSSFYLEDLNSVNGTYLNGLMVEDKTLLKDKDIVSFGEIEFLFVLGDDQDAEE